MKISQLLVQNADKKIFLVITMLISAGIAHGLLLYLINTIITLIDIQEKSFILPFFSSYLIAAMLFFYAKQYSYFRLAELIENTLEKIKLRLVQKLQQSDFYFIQDNNNIKTILTNNTKSISQSLFFIIEMIEALIVIIICTVYIGLLSIKALFLIIVSGLVVAYAAYDYQQKHNALLDKNQKQTSELEYFIQLIEKGFLQVRKSQLELFIQKIQPLIKTVHQDTILVHKHMATNIVFSNMAFFLIIAIILFLLTHAFFESYEIVVQILIVFFFASSAISTIIAYLPVFYHVNIQIQDLQDFENTLNKALLHTLLPAEYSFKDFHYIQLQNIGFKKEIWQIENIHLEIQKGEIVFITGGKGNGKSTLLKIIAGLYYPNTGKLWLDNKVINADNYLSYQDLFSIYLENSPILPHIAEENAEKVNNLLKFMQLEHHISYKENNFTYLQELTLAQQQRLALLINLLDDKPIYIFDEWAADQNAHFRKFFYYNILQYLRKKGKTIIIASNDRHYFNMADKLISLQFGKITAVKKR